MSRKRGKRKLTLCCTVTEEAYDKALDIADTINDGNLSKTIEMLINEYKKNDIIHIKEY